MSLYLSTEAYYNETYKGFPPKKTFRSNTSVKSLPIIKIIYFFLLFYPRAPRRTATSSGLRSTTSSPPWSGTTCPRGTRSRRTRSRIQVTSWPTKSIPNRNKQMVFSSLSLLLFKEKTLRSCLHMYTVPLERGKHRFLLGEISWSAFFPTPPLGAKRKFIVLPTVYIPGQWP